MIVVIPAILENNFQEIEKKVKAVEGMVEWVQIDFADGTLVPNSTFFSLGEFKKLKTTIKLEAHLMVKDPIKYLSQLNDSGFKRIYAHVESGQADQFINECYKYDCQVGLAIDGPTKI